MPWSFGIYAVALFVGGTIIIAILRKLLGR